MSRHLRTPAFTFAALVGAFVLLHLTSAGTIPGRNVAWWPADQLVLLLGLLVKRSVTVRDALSLQVASIGALWFAAAFWAVACFAIVRVILIARRRLRSPGV
jgi:hypothetical protein